MFTSVQQSSESTAKRKLSNQVCRSCIDDDDDDVYHLSAFVLCYLWPLWCYVHSKFFGLHLFLYLLVSWAWWDWLFTGWPLVRKIWKCQGTWQLSGKCQGFY